MDSAGRIVVEARLEALANSPAQTAADIVDVQSGFDFVEVQAGTIISSA